MDACLVDRSKLPGRHGTEAAQCAPQRFRSDVPALPAPFRALVGRHDRSARATGYRSGAIRNYAQAMGPARNGAASHPGGAVEVVSDADM